MNECVFLIVAQKIHPQTAAGPFAAGQLFKMLSAVGFCGGQYSRGFCYKIGQLLLGFNDDNINKVSVQQLLPGPLNHCLKEPFILRCSRAQLNSIMVYFKFYVSLLFYLLLSFTFRCRFICFIERFRQCQAIVLL